MKTFQKYFKFCMNFWVSQIRPGKGKFFFPFVITNVKGRHLLESTGCVTPLSPSPRNINLAVANISGNSSESKINRRIVMEDAQSNLPNSETVGNHLLFFSSAVVLQSIPSLLFLPVPEEPEYQFPQSTHNPFRQSLYSMRLDVILVATQGSLQFFNRKRNYKPREDDITV